MPLSHPRSEPSNPSLGNRPFFILGLAFAGVNVILVTMLAISVLRLLDNPLYVRSTAIISGIAVLAVVLRLARRTALANIVIGLQFVISIVLLTDGLDGVAY